MLRPLVAILPGPFLPSASVVPRPDVAVARFDSVAALLARIAVEPATCIVADGAALTAAGSLAVRAACPDSTLCVIAEHHVLGADAVIAPDDDLGDRVAALVRFALGEPMRCGPRLIASGALHIDRRRRMPILDIAEGGVRAAAPPDRIITDAALRIELDDGPIVAARGHEIRRTRTSVVIALHGLVGRDRTSLRRWMLSHRGDGARVTRAPRAPAPMETRAQP